MEYNGRPERYFDRSNDPRRYPTTTTTGDSQHTRDALIGSSLLDLAFDEPSSSSSSSLPDAQYLPAIQRQQQLEQQLAERDAQLLLLSKQQHQHHQQQQQSQNDVGGIIIIIIITITIITIIIFIIIRATGFEYVINVTDTVTNDDDGSADAYHAYD